MVPKQVSCVRIKKEQVGGKEIKNTAVEVCYAEPENVIMRFRSLSRADAHQKSLCQIAEGDIDPRLDWFGRRGGATVFDDEKLRAYDRQKSAVWHEHTGAQDSQEEDRKATEDEDGFTGDDCVEAVQVDCQEGEEKADLKINFQENHQVEKVTEQEGGIGRKNISRNYNTCNFVKCFHEK